MSQLRRCTLVAFVISIGLVLGGGEGCTSSNTTAKIVEYRTESQLPTFKDAPNDATYGLYASWDPNPIVKFPLNKGDRLGFDRDENGNLVGIAGNNRYPLRTEMMVGNYYWAMMHP